MTSVASILIATPVKNAVANLRTYFRNLQQLTYPHAALSVAFLESDSDDGTHDFLVEVAREWLPDFASVEVYRKDFGYHPTVPRWTAEIQYERRAILARSRNILVQRALRDQHWVLWLDSDVVRYPADVIETLLATGRDIVVPHCLAQSGRTFDLNTFQIADEAFDWSPYVTEGGIVQPPKGVGRRYLEDLRGQTIVPVDGVGGTMLLIRADLHREGLVFPPFSYRMYIETEGLAMMARDMGYRCWGLPDVEIVHA